MTLNDNDFVKKRKGAKDRPKNEGNSYILNEKEKLLKDEDISPDVKSVIDEVFTEMTVGEIKDDPFNVSDNISSTESNIHDTELSNEEASSIENKEEIEKLYKSKQKELNDKIRDYDRRYQKLEDTTGRYEEKTRELIEKRKEFEEKIKEFEKKNQALEDTKEEFSIRSKKIQEAREQFVELSKQIEMTKIDLEKKEKKFKNMQRAIEANKYELEKNKIDFEKEKLEFKHFKTDLETTAQDLDINEYKEKVIDEIADVKEKKVEGKAEILEDLLQELNREGNFQSSFLIDGKGMMVSEISKFELDSVAIGAMFSLTCTVVLRAVKSLNLQELLYFKLSAANGEFLVKNININNYKRNFVLLAYYDSTASTIPVNKQKINKKTLNRILKSVKEDFNEFGQENRQSWVFDNLVEKINFLKQSSTIPKADLELLRLKLLNIAAIKIKELFET